MLLSSSERVGRLTRQSESDIGLDVHGDDDDLPNH